MLHAYLDESYNEDFYFMAGAVGSPAQWEQVSDGLQRIRDRAAREWGVPVDAEFHAHEVLGGGDEWSPLRRKHFEAATIIREVMQVAADAGVVVVFRGVNVSRLRARYRYPDPPAKVTLQHTLERIDGRARTTADTVQVVADHVDSAAQHVRELQTYKTVGTPGYRPSHLPQIESLNFSDSRTSDGLQIADAFAYTYHRNHSCNTGRVSEDRRAARLRKGHQAVLESCCWEQGIWHP